MDKDKNKREHVTIIQISGEKNKPAKIMQIAGNKGEAPTNKQGNGNGEALQMRPTTAATESSEGSEGKLQARKISSEVDGKRKEKNSSVGARRADQQQTEKGGLAAFKNSAEGMMDIALLSANANQLRFLITYNAEAWSFYICMVLVVLSLVLQLSVGIALILRRTLKHPRLKACISHTMIASGVFMVMAINVLLSAFTSTN